MKRFHITIHGAVQGVGFRPFVYNAALDLDLKGWVRNDSAGVAIEIEGDEDRLDAFLTTLRTNPPERASIQSLKITELDVVGYKQFVIDESATDAPKTAFIMPDIATCAQCLQEIFDPNNRRYQYPFTNCTHCGPRYSIIEELPYDRFNTSMSGFEMCPECQTEYEDPTDRRFHAQPNACPVCGPKLQLWDEEGQVKSNEHQALRDAVEMIAQGSIVAVKGLGGFHLMADATNDEAIKRLRYRKSREEKPLAVMFADIHAVSLECVISVPERTLLNSPEAPIVLCKKHERYNSKLSGRIARGNPYLGCMIAYTPLHHIMLRLLKRPVVATSANISDEPICYEEREALERLDYVADAYLVHNRPVVRHVDDSIVRLMAGRLAVMRRARGFAPLPVTLKDPLLPVLAVGPHMKNTIALTLDNQVFLSQHIGDLETKASMNAFTDCISSLINLYHVTPEKIAYDSHPLYLSTQYAKEEGSLTQAVQHHHAHIVSCMAENHLDEEVLGIAWDGTGFGQDETIWGGEFLTATLKDYKRVAHFQPFPLAGADKAVKEPCRSALGWLYEAYGKKCFSFEHLPTINEMQQIKLTNLEAMLEKGINTIKTSSVGRLFDAVASLTGLRQVNNYEGQAAMELEFAASKRSSDSGDHYPFEIIPAQDGAFVIKTEVMLDALVADVTNEKGVVKISRKFHNTLLAIALEVAKRIGIKKIVLSGGCFQNRLLTEGLIARLRAFQFEPYWHQNVPPNDGGVALGQAVVAGSQ